MFQEEEPIDLEHEENVRKFKEENEARKRKLRDFQKLLEDRLINICGTSRSFEGIKF